MRNCLTIGSSVSSNSSTLPVHTTLPSCRKITLRETQRTVGIVQVTGRSSHMQICLVYGRLFRLFLLLLRWGILHQIRRHTGVIEVSGWLWQWRRKSQYLHISRCNRWGYIHPEDVPPAQTASTAGVGTETTTVAEGWEEAVLMTPS